MELRVPEIPAQASSVTNRENAKGPMNLLLAQIEQQTHDTKTLRFRIPNERQLRVKPEQFLTFQWTIDGQRVMRSCTVSSSGIHRNYVEITPKRMENGCVSVFLNDLPQELVARLRADQACGALPPGKRSRVCLCGREGGFFQG